MLFISSKNSIFWKIDDISADKKDFCSNSARCLHQSENVPARCLCLGADSSITFGSQCQYSLPLIAILFISSLCIFIIVIIAAFIIKVRKFYRGLQIRLQRLKNIKIKYGRQYSPPPSQVWFSFNQSDWRFDQQIKSKNQSEFRLKT